MADYLAYFNGEWVPYSQVRIDPNDRGFRVGDVVFDAARTFDGKIFRMGDHVDRLYRSLKYARIDPGLPPEQMLAISEEAVQRNEHLRSEAGEFIVYSFVTRGLGPSAHDAGPSTVCVNVQPLPFGRYASYYHTGVHGVIARTRSYSSQSLDPKIKHYSRMNFNLAELEVADVDPEAWPILLDLEGNLSEGTRNNIFLVTGGVIRTPDDHSVLQGISRAAVLDFATQLGISSATEALQPYDLYNADEAFFSGTGPCIIPVSKVDQRPIGTEVPGPVTKMLLAAWSEAVGVDIVDQATGFAGS